MMRVTFLAHSGFLVELDTVCLLFDWCKGTLPVLPNKPLICFASHRHSDHFDPKIFCLKNGPHDVRYLLGSDIVLTPQNQEEWGITKETLDQCISMRGGETVEIAHGIQVETLTSTDEGVAFIICCEGKTIYHAGDLNWWHWEGEEMAWNRNMEVNFKRFIEPLRERTIDLAFVPLDSRLEQSTDWGFRYFLELTKAKVVLPMHQWEDYQPTIKFLEKNPKYSEIVLPVERAGQSWEF